MSQIITIKDGMVYLREENPTGDGGTLFSESGPVPLATWAEALFERTNRRVFVPSLAYGNVIAFSQFRGKSMYVVEQKPAVLAIKEMTDNRTTLRERKIAFPWVYFGVQLLQGEFATLYCFFSTQRVSRRDTLLGKPALPNCYDACNVCMGTSIDRERNQTEQDVVDMAIRTFWAAPFNQDVIDNFNYAKEHIRGFPRSFAAWEEMSIDPTRRNLLLTLSWAPSGESIDSLLGKVDV